MDNTSGSGLSCEWGSRDDCLDVATPTEVVDPEGNVISMNLCVNCVKDHDVAVYRADGSVARRADCAYDAKTYRADGTVIR